VLDVESKGETLRVTVQRNGPGAPNPTGDLPGARPEDSLSQTIDSDGLSTDSGTGLEKKFPELTLAPLSTSMDLERSFGPIYARGLLKRGQSEFAVVGVNRQELQSSIDAALTFGILWLDVCRQAHSAKLVVEGLKLVLPDGCSALARERIANLNQSAAKWELYELEERSEEIKSIEVSDRGNVSTRLLHCAEEESIFSRFAEPIAVVRALMPEAEIGLTSPVEISFRCHGLEFARARLPAKPGEFRSVSEIVFGAAPGSEFSMAQTSRNSSA
jgi:hypothetical protein